MVRAGDRGTGLGSGPWGTTPFLWDTSVSLFCSFSCQSGGPVTHGTFALVMAGSETLKVGEVGG